MKAYPRKLASIRTILITSLLVLMIFPILVITIVTYYKENSIFQDLVSRLGYCPFVWTISFPTLIKEVHAQDGWNQKLGMLL